MEVWRSVQISIRKKSCEKNSTNFLSSWCFFPSGNGKHFPVNARAVGYCQRPKTNDVYIELNTRSMLRVRDICEADMLSKTTRLSFMPFSIGFLCCCLLKFIVMLLGNPVECTASVNMPYYGVYFVSRSLFRGASFPIRFSFSHLIKGSPFSICREQLFCVPFFSIPIYVVVVVFSFFVVPKPRLLAQTSKPCVMQSYLEMVRNQKYGTNLVMFYLEWWEMAWRCPLSLRLLMVFDHKLINYGLFWISVSGLSLHNRVHLSLCFNFNFRICQTWSLLFFPLIWHIHWMLGQCLPLFHLSIYRFSERGMVFFIDFFPILFAQCSYLVEPNAKRLPCEIVSTETI